MVELKRHQIIKYTEKWFADYINPKDKYDFVYYLYSSINTSLFGFKKELSHTIIIDLTQSENEIFEKFHSKYRNEIRRAVKEGIIFSIAHEDELEKFKDEYNKFAARKKLVLISQEKLNSLKNNSILTKTEYKGKIINYHLYLTDESRIVRLLYSIDVYHNDIDRKYVGWSNKFLHYQDMLFFKKKGYNVYDFGGYAKNTKDKGLEGINNFKQKFGGEIIEQYSYISFPYYLVILLKRLIVKIRRKFAYKN